jgi:hypothetical protein
MLVVYLTHNHHRSAIPGAVAHGALPSSKTGILPAKLREILTMGVKDADIFG